MKKKTRTKVSTNRKPGSRGKGTARRVNPVVMQKSQGVPTWAIFAGVFVAGIFILAIAVGVSASGSGEQTAQGQVQVNSHKTPTRRRSSNLPKWKPSGPGSWAEDMKKNGADKNPYLLARQARVKKFEHNRRTKKSEEED